MEHKCYALPQALQGDEVFYWRYLMQYSTVAVRPCSKEVHARVSVTDQKVASPLQKLELKTIAS